MTKRDLVARALEAARCHGRSMTLADMDAALESLCEVAAAELLGGGEVPLPTIGKLKARASAARKGRNPRTGEAFDVPAGTRVVFAPCRNLKDALKA